MIESRRPDIFVVDKKEHMGIIFDIAVPDDVRVGEKEPEKAEEYQELKRERLIDCGSSSMWKL